jgi:hypothetical protein
MSDNGWYLLLKGKKAQIYDVSKLPFYQSNRASAFIIWPFKLLCIVIFAPGRGASFGAAFTKLLK